VTGMLYKFTALSQTSCFNASFPRAATTGCMTHGLGVWPGAVKTGKAAGPENVLHTDLRHTTKTTLFLMSPNLRPMPL